MTGFFNSFIMEQSKYPSVLVKEGKKMYWAWDDKYKDHYIKPDKRGRRHKCKCRSYTYSELINKGYEIHGTVTTRNKLPQ
jgi:hypothetical protein